MLLLANILMGVATVLSSLISILTFIIIVAIFISWFQPNPYNCFVIFLRDVTEPIFALPRRYFRTIYGRMDVAPIFVFLGLTLFQWIVVNSLMDYGRYLRVSALSGEYLETAAEDDSDYQPPAAKGRTL